MPEDDDLSLSPRAFNSKTALCDLNDKEQLMFLVSGLKYGLKLPEDCLRPELDRLTQDRCRIGQRLDKLLVDSSLSRRCDVYDIVDAEFHYAETLGRIEGVKTVAEIRGIETWHSSSNRKESK